MDLWLFYLWHQNPEEEKEVSEDGGRERGEVKG
jgi:hypothetical protein